jgi:tetratricopeptide (TPR) repeat protein
VLIAGDHGESLGEHGEETHAMFIYEATQAVPLLLRPPDGDAWETETWRNRRVAGLVSLVDLLPTAWNALGFAQQELPPVAGRSLLPIVLAEGTPHDWVYCETLVPHLDYGMSDLRGLSTGAWKYIRAPRPELYNLDDDPAELNNLAEQERERVAELEARLATILEGLEDTRAPLAMDEETIERLRSLGYLGGSTSKESPRDDPRTLLAVIPAVERAEALVHGNRISEGLAVIDSLLRLHPNTPVILRLRAYALLRGGRSVEALEAHDLALAECAGCPDEFDLLRGKASASLAAGQLTEALQLADELLAARPGEPGLHTLRGEILEAQGRMDEALAEYRRDAELFPDQARSLMRAAQLLRAQNRAREAEQALREAVQRRPRDPQPLVALAELLEATGRATEASTCIERALEANPDDPAAHYRKAWLLRRSGRADEAIAEYQAAARSMPGDARIPFEIGSLYSEMGRKEQAAQYYESAIALGNAPAKAYANLGVLHAQKGELPEAIELWQQALQQGLAPGDANQIRAHIEQAEQMLRVGSAGR